MRGYFLDSSALAKLYHREPGSEFLERLLSQQGLQAFISRLSLVEIESVLAIKVRTGELDSSGQTLARRRLRADISQARIRVGPPIEDSHYQTARRLVMSYGVEMGLRTLDAVQLAIALDLHSTGLISFIVAADVRLCRVAEDRGCSTINPAEPGVVIPA